MLTPGQAHVRVLVGFHSLLVRSLFAKIALLAKVERTRSEQVANKTPVLSDSKQVFTIS